MVPPTAVISLHLSSAQLPWPRPKLSQSAVIIMTSHYTTASAAFFFDSFHCFNSLVIITLFNTQF